MSSCRGRCWWSGSAASLAANVAVAEPTVTGRVIAAWPSFALIASYELLMRQVRRAAETTPPFNAQASRQSGRTARAEAALAGNQVSARMAAPARGGVAGTDVQLEAWRWAQNNRADDGSLPSGREIGIRYGRHERWGRLVKRSGLAGDLGTLEPEQQGCGAGGMG